MNYTLCRYGPGRSADLARFVVPIAGETYARWVGHCAAVGWAHSEHGVDAWDVRLADPSTHVLVCERPDGSIAACGFLRITADTAHLGGLYVGDVARGLGTRLCEERLKISRAAGARTAVMFIRETNTPARALAEKAGFSVVDQRPCERLSTVTRLLYSMSLDARVLLPV